MNNWTRSIVVACVGATSFIALPTAAEAGVGDLLVAPTRVVLDGRKGAEIILNNIGDDAATYRVSIEFRRMTESGELVDVPTPTEADVKAEDMIVYAPRKVTLAPHEPQAIRIAARAPEGLPDGEYRVHMLFRAIPPATPVTSARRRGGQGSAVQADSGLWSDDSGHRAARQPPGNRRHRQRSPRIGQWNAGGRARPHPAGLTLDLWRGSSPQGRYQGAHRDRRRASPSTPK